MLYHASQVIVESHYHAQIHRTYLVHQFFLLVQDMFQKLLQLQQNQIPQEHYVPHMLQLILFL